MARIHLPYHLPCHHPFHHPCLLQNRTAIVINAVVHTFNDAPGFHPSIQAHYIYCLIKIEELGCTSNRDLRGCFQQRGLGLQERDEVQTDYEHVSAVSEVTDVHQPNLVKQIVATVEAVIPSGLERKLNELHELSEQTSMQFRRSLALPNHHWIPRSLQSRLSGCYYCQVPPSTRQTHHLYHPQSPINLLRVCSQQVSSKLKQGPQQGLSQLEPQPWASSERVPHHCLPPPHSQSR